MGSVHHQRHSLSKTQAPTNPSIKLIYTSINLGNISLLIFLHYHVWQYISWMLWYRKHIYIYLSCRLQNDPICTNITKFRRQYWTNTSSDKSSDERTEKLMKVNQLTLCSPILCINIFESFMLDWWWNETQYWNWSKEQRAPIHDHVMRWTNNQASEIERQSEYMRIAHSSLPVGYSEDSQQKESSKKSGKKCEFV